MTKQTMWLHLGVAMGVAAMSGGVLAGPALKTLAPKQCVALAQSPLAQMALPSAWDAYKAYIKVCPLQASRKGPAKVSLVTVFGEAYLKAYPDEGRWPAFPRPLLVGLDGTCLAKLPELYPFDEPRTLVLRFGREVEGIPGEIRVHVNDPAIGGGYDLPTLTWAPQNKTYEALQGSTIYKREDMTCPN